MKTFEEFRIMELRPAHYNGTVFETEVEFKETSVFGVGIAVAKALNATVGDTAKIRGKVFGNESDCEFISIIMSGEELEKFIEKYGVCRISGKVRMKLEQVYAVYNSTDFCYEPREEEITAYKLIEIIDD